MRLARPSGTGALESLGFIGPLPIDLDPRLQAVLEVRPQRPEEHLGYSIFRWQRRITITAVAARFGGIAVGLGGITDRDALHVVEAVRWYAGGSVAVIGLGAIPAYANGVSGGVFARDNRIAGAGAVELYNGIWQGGDLAAIPPGAGSSYDALNGAAATGAYDEVVLGHVFKQGQPATADALLITCATANVLFNAGIRGYTVTPR